MNRPRGGLLLSLCVACSVACGGSSPDARYPAREPGCPVKSYPGASTLPVDDLGIVRVQCTSNEPCERQLLDRVCGRGGDVAWGMADNAIGATTLVAHAAHTKRATQGPRERGCAVQVFTDKPPGSTENIGPVSALCTTEDTRDTCLRELSDQVCLLGGDILWQVDGPTPEDTQNGPRQRMHGRAAHTK
jgi:hypothetical protein